MSRSAGAVSERTVQRRRSLKFRDYQRDLYRKRVGGVREPHRQHRCGICGGLRHNARTCNLAALYVDEDAVL